MNATSFSFLIYGLSLGGYVLLSLTRWRYINKHQLKLRSLPAMTTLGAIFLSYGFLLYPLTTLKEQLFYPRYPLFSLENISLVDDSEDFIDVAVTATGTWLGFYWQKEENTFYYKELAAVGTEKKEKSALPAYPVSSLGEADWVSTSPYQLTQASPWLPLPIVKGAYMIRSRWESASPTNQTFTLQLTLRSPVPTSQEAPLSLAVSQATTPTNGKISSVSSSMALLYTASAQTLYYTALDEKTQRYTLQQFPLTPPAHASTAAPTPYFNAANPSSPPNEGHYYNPFYWQSLNALSYVSIEKIAAASVTAGSTTSPVEDAAKKNKAAWYFQTLINITDATGAVRYQKPLVITQRPELIVLKWASDQEGEFLGYTAPLHSGVLYFLYMTPTSKFIPFALDLPTFEAVPSFAFTPRPASAAVEVLGGILFTGLPARQNAQTQTTQRNIYWAERMRTLSPPPSWEKERIFLFCLCLGIALGLLAYGWRGASLQAELK